MSQFFYDRFPYQEFMALVFHLRNNGASFHSCTELGRAPLAHGVSFRYDVHARDIAGAYDFLAAHYSSGIPATFFLLANYSRTEDEHYHQFRALAEHIKKPTDIGLHDSPVDSFLITQKFNGKAVEYWHWLKSDKSVEWFASLAQSASSCELFQADVMDAFMARVEWMREEFGNFLAVASHGGQLSQSYRKRVGQLEKTGEFISSLFAENWLTSERLASVGLVADVEQFRKKAPLLYQITDGGGTINSMIQNLNTYFIDRKRAVQILIHPYTWGGPLGASGGKRDAEITVLLGVHKGATAIGGRKWHQRLLRTRLMVTPHGYV